jgi:C4-type Zn-finger protein
MAMDIGISEQEFWHMTFAEIVRAAECWQRKQKIRLQEKARLTYILADLIGHSVSRIYSQNAKMPTLNEAFPTLFDTTAEEEKQSEAQAEMSALRFMQFAQAHNKKKGGAFEN